MAAFLLVWLAPQWHGVAAIHSWCAAHSVVEHESAGHHEHAAAPTSVVQPATAEHALADQAGRSADRFTTGEPEALHADVCALAVLGRVAVTEAECDRAGAFDLVFSAPRASRSATELPRSIPLLREAPKTSPPSLNC